MPLAMKLFLSDLYLKGKYVAEGFQNRILSSMLYKVIVCDTYSDIKNTIINLFHIEKSLKSMSLANFIGPHGSNLFASL